MEKLFDDITYTQKAEEANTLGKQLYIYVHSVEYQAEVLEWNYIEEEETRPKYDEEGNPITHKETILNPIYNEQGEIIGYDEPTEIDVQDTETVIVQKPIPKMVEEAVIDPETGEVITIIVQAHHTETFTKEVAELLIDDEFKYIVFDGNYTYCEANPNYSDDVRAKLDKLTLTPADVERALYKAKGMNFEDLKELISTTMTGIDMKALGTEFGASLFYRGAKYGNGKLFDIIGSLLGYTSEDMDYLFENKELPNENQ